MAAVGISLSLPYALTGAPVAPSVAQAVRVGDSPQVTLSTLRVNVADAISVSARPDASCPIGHSLYMPYGVSGPGALAINTSQAVSTSTSVAVNQPAGTTLRIIVGKLALGGKLGASTHLGGAPETVTARTTVTASIETTPLGVNVLDRVSARTSVSAGQAVAAPLRINVGRLLLGPGTRLGPNTRLGGRGEPVAIQTTASVVATTLRISLRDAVAVADAPEISHRKGVRVLGAITVTTAAVARPEGITHNRVLGEIVAIHRVSQALVHARAQGNLQLSARALPPGLVHTRVLVGPSVNQQTVTVEMLDRV